MKVAISSYNGAHVREHPGNDRPDIDKVQWVLGFGAKTLLEKGGCYDQLSRQYPRASIILCSTAGEIFNEEVYDDTVSITAVQFERTAIAAVSANIMDFADSYEAGIALIKRLPVVDNLCYIMVISDGTLVNGSELVNGINMATQCKVPVTGGMASDGDRFVSTLVGLNEDPAPGNLIAIGFYSTHLLISHGSVGGCSGLG